MIVASDLRALRSLSLGARAFCVRVRYVWCRMIVVCDEPPAPGDPCPDPTSNMVYQPSDGTATFSSDPTNPVESNTNWLPSTQVHSYGTFIAEDECCGCEAHNCGADERMACCQKYKDTGSYEPFGTVTSCTGK